ncbi:MAG: hypothetical protein RR800_02785 [Comamonas sp.]
MKQLLSLLALLAISPGALAIMKCSNGTQTWYQDAPCQSGMQATEIQTAPAPILAAPLAGSGQIVTLPQEPTRPLPPPPAHIPASVYEQEAKLCLAWYQKEMQLPPGTQYLDFTKEQRVLTITIPVRASIVNQFGIVNETTFNKKASCEIHNGKLDNDWTRIHAKRGGWIQ